MTLLRCCLYATEIPSWVLPVAFKQPIAPGNFALNQVGSRDKERSSDPRYRPHPRNNTPCPKVRFSFLFFFFFFNSGPVYMDVGGIQVGEVARLSIWYLIVIWSRLHDRWGDPPRRVAWSARPGNPRSQGQILLSKLWRWRNPPSWGPIRDTSNSRKIHFGGGFASLLKETVKSHSTDGCSKSSKWREEKRRALIAKHVVCQHISCLCA